MEESNLYKALQKDLRSCIGQVPKLGNNLFIMMPLPAVPAMIMGEAKGELDQTTTANPPLVERHRNPEAALDRYQNPRDAAVAEINALIREINSLNSLSVMTVKAVVVAPAGPSGMELRQEGEEGEPIDFLVYNIGPSKGPRQ